MQTLPVEYLAEIAKQLAFLSTFLGGFAATILATLLVADSTKRSASLSIGCAAFAAVGFIVAATSFVMMTVVLRPDAPANVSASSSLNHARLVGILGFAIGLYSLLAGLGFSGWIRSRKLGIVTSVAAALGVVFVTWALQGFS